MSITYKDSGVDIDAGAELVNRIKPIAKSTTRPEVLSNIGGFGALFELTKKFDHPILVSGTDGVGTKLKLAQDWGMHDTIGIDLVAMSVNDIIVNGAEPLFFLDYFSCGTLDVDVAEQVIEGIALGCRWAGCALIGGETAEMPGMYEDGTYDLAGFAVGAVEKFNLIDGESMSEGDIVLGLASSGLHSNGFSLVRKIIEKSGYNLDMDYISGQSFKSVIMEPTRIYAKSIMAIMEEELPIQAMAHITGGGITGNIGRIVPKDMTVEIDCTSWKIPQPFCWLQNEGDISYEEMLKTFNCGIGFVVVVDPMNVDLMINLLEKNGETVYEIGKVVPDMGQPVKII
jgi:phosphoribosylformylglycinamidine cyclo-ligase